MKKVLLVLCVALVAVALVGCAPKIRIIAWQDFTAANGITQASVSANDASWDLTGLLDNQYTDYEKVAKEDQYVSEMKMNNVVVQKSTNYWELKAMKKYTVVQGALIQD